MIAGIYVRAERDGRGRSLDLIELTGSELKAWMKEKNRDQIEQMVSMLIGIMKRA
jgi:hypothetical protein